LAFVIVILWLHGKVIIINIIINIKLKSCFYYNV